MGLVLFSLTFLFGYLLGSIPFGYLISKSKNIDIRKVGSGNIGATNVSRKLGFKLGLLVGILDFLKSYLFVAFIFSLNHTPLTFKIILSFAPIIGHLFPVWLKFKGGKGVSCTFGLLTGIFGIKFILIWLIIWLILLSITRLMSLVNLLMSLSFPILFYIQFKTITAIIWGLFLTLIIWWTHRQNIKKLIKGDENKLFSSKIK